MHEMDMRHYDPAIARWVVQDPVTHHSLSPYNAFDNNPVFWADPSGADSENGSDPIIEETVVITSRVDEHNVTHITQTTTRTTTTTNEDGSVTVTYSSGTITNTVDANGKVTNGTTVTTVAGTVTKDVDGNIKVGESTTTTKDVTSDDKSSALNKWTNTVSDYNTNHDGVYNIDRINKLSDKTTRATKAGVAVLAIFGGLDKLAFGKLNPKQKGVFRLLGGTTSSEGIVGTAGNYFKSKIGKNNNYFILYDVKYRYNDKLIKDFKDSSTARKRVGPTSFQDLWNKVKRIFKD